MSRFGYAGEILKVDLSDGNISRLPSADYTDRFLGGRGVAARLYWEMVPPQTMAYDAKNCLIYVTGPVAGFTGLGGCRWQVCGKSPIMEPEAFSYANLGEKWGSWLKYAGYDGLVVQGKADRPSYLFINDGTVEIRDASTLWGKFAIESADSLKAELGENFSVLTIGPAAENLVSFATMLTDDGASGASGLGSVMGSKNLKAIVVAGSKRPQAAHLDKFKEIVSHLLKLRKDTWKNWLEDIPGRTKLRPCYGCGSGCFRKSYQAEGGRRFKYFCQATHVYAMAAMNYSSDSTEVALMASRLCDRYGLDTTIMQPLIEWLSGCYREGVLTEADTGLPLSKIGSVEFIETLTRKIGLREGFGDLLAQGIIKTAEKIGKGAQQLSANVLTRAGETRDYDPRLVLTNAILYAMEQRRPINQVHELCHALWLWRNYQTGVEDAFLSTEDFITVGRNFWGGEVAADFSTYEGKALAAKKIQDRTYAKESLILCDFLWPIIWVRFAPDHTGDPFMESRVFSAITGKDIDKEELDGIGERIYNMQRAVLLRDGWGGRKGDRLFDYLHDEPLQFVFFNPDCMVPGKKGEPVSRKGAKIKREDFEDLKSEYYGLRGWDIESGLPTEKKLQELELADIATELKSRELLR